MIMEFKMYQHVERFGTTEVQNIELGKVFVFPKIDGTNASLWWTIKDGVGRLNAGSRKRELSLDDDNAGFFNWCIQQPQAESFASFFHQHPNKRLYGEWLCPHSLRTYRDDVWRKLYVFDVTEEDGDEFRYVPYEEYKPLLEKFGINYIPAICSITNASYEQLVNQLIKNVFLIEDGKGIGEGIVIKNYEYRNKYGRQTWAKIVTSEFKEKHSKEMGAPEMKGEKKIEEEIAKKYVTTALCEKVKAKIEIETDGFSSKQIPRLLNTIYYDIVKEESWNMVKKFKNPTINYKTLQHFIFAQIKTCMPMTF